MRQCCGLQEIQTSKLLLLLSEKFPVKKIEEPIRTPEKQSLVHCSYSDFYLHHFSALVRLLVRQPDYAKNTEGISMKLGGRMGQRVPVNF